MLAVYGADVEKIDWTLEHRPKSHPIPVMATRTELLNMDTGEVLAEVKPGFEFYWNHQHPHVFSVGSPPLTKKERRALKS